MPTATQHFTIPMPLLLLYQALAALRSSCTEGYVRSACLGVHNVVREFMYNVYGPQLLYSDHKFRQLILAHILFFERKKIGGGGGQLEIVSTKIRKSEDERL